MSQKTVTFSTVYTRMPKEMYEVLEERARKEGFSMSMLVRKILVREFGLTLEKDIRGYGFQKSQEQQLDFLTEAPATPHKKKVLKKATKKKATKK